MGSCAYPIDHREVWSETGSVLSRTAPRDILGDAITSFIGYYKVSQGIGLQLVPKATLQYMVHSGRQGIACARLFDIRDSVK